MSVSPCHPPRARNGPRRHFVMERVTWRRTGLISERAPLALGFGFAGRDVLGWPIFAGSTQLYLLVAADARRAAILGEAAE